MSRSRQEDVAGRTGELERAVLRWKGLAACALTALLVVLAFAGLVVSEQHAAVGRAREEARQYKARAHREAEARARQAEEASGRPGQGMVVRPAAGAARTAGRRAL